MRRTRTVRQRSLRRAGCLATRGVCSGRVSLRFSGGCWVSVAEPRPEVHLVGVDCAEGDGRGGSTGRCRSSETECALQSAVTRTSRRRRSASTSKSSTFAQLGMENRVKSVSRTSSRGADRRGGSRTGLEKAS